MSTAAALETSDAKPKRRAGRIVALICGVAATLAGGAFAGVYAVGQSTVGSASTSEDNERPKLVERQSEADLETQSGDEAAPPKTGTVSVAHDRVRIDRKRFEATYFPIEQNFTANLADGTGFVQVGLSVSTYFDGKVIANLKRQAVPIRSAILLVLSDQDAEVLATPEGKKQLQLRLTQAINEVLRSHEGFGGIDNVYFTTLVIQ